MRVGITGANGFVGKNLVHYLRQQGDFDVEELDGDVTDELVVDGFECDALVHLAGENRNEDQLHLLDTNVLGTYTVARHCLKNKIRLLVAGSISTKGLYGASKRICESIIQHLGDNGLDAAYLKLCNLYGPHCRPHYNSFATTLLYCIANDIPCEHFINNPRDKIQLMHVRDVCQNIEGLMRMERMDVGFKSSRVIDFCLATEVTISLGDFFRVAKGLKPEGYGIRGRDIQLIRETLNWYRENASTKTH